MTPDISIVVPVHNAELYISQALDSFLAQTCATWEAICVDDASSDNSWDVLSDYSRKDDRIRIYRNNSGKWAGWSRNFALDKSQGCFVMFCDADDWYSPNACELMLAAADRGNKDIVQCYAKIEQAPDAHCGAAIPNLEYFNPPVKWGGIFRRPHRGLNTVCWNKIIRRDFILDNNIRFSCNKRHEDDLFCAECAIAAKKTKILPVPLYHYRIHGASMTQSACIGDESRLAWISNVEAIKEWGRLNGYSDNRLLKKYVGKWESYS